MVKFRIGLVPEALCRAPAAAERRHKEFAPNAETVRQIVHHSAGGVALQLRFSNQFGTVPLASRSVHIARAAEGVPIDVASDAVATVGGQADFTIAPGAPVRSDSVQLQHEDSNDIVVSLFR